MKLLVVDDDADVLGTVMDTLIDAGFQVVQACSAEEAIMKLAIATPDALVTDLDLGQGMTGIQLAAEVRRRLPGLPILYISGRPWPAHPCRLDANEAFLPKPFRQRALVSGLQAVAGPPRAVTPAASLSAEPFGTQASVSG